MHLAIGVLLAIVVVLISGSESAIVRGSFKDPAHPGKCVVEGLILEKGQTGRAPKVCARVMCGNNSEGQIHSCGTEGVPPGYKFGKYMAPDADYPACCKREIIKE